MNASLRALLSGLIDYAGLFPPAKLPLPEALANYVLYRAGNDGWMLGRFICPASRLNELTSLADLIRDGPPLIVSALGRGGATSDEFLAGLRSDLADIVACRECLASRVVIDVMEVRLPAEMPAARVALIESVELTRQAGLTMFFETSATQPKVLPELLRIIRETPFVSPAGFKLRAGGLEASAFPSSEHIAFALTACQSAGVPFKATAGLHHPLPRFDSGVQARMHGFINLFTAGVLVSERGLGIEQVRAILDDADPTHFRFSDAGVEWQGLSATTEEIGLARRQAVMSFGSCSFDEPRDDLRALGWL